MCWGRPSTLGDVRNGLNWIHGPWAKIAVTHKYAPEVGSSCGPNPTRAMPLFIHAILPGYNKTTILPANLSLPCLSCLLSLSALHAAYKSPIFPNVVRRQPGYGRTGGDGLRFSRIVMVRSCSRPEVDDCLWIRFSCTSTLSGMNRIIAAHPHLHGATGLAMERYGYHPTTNRPSRARYQHGNTVVSGASIVMPCPPSPLTAQVEHGDLSRTNTTCDQRLSPRDLAPPLPASDIDSDKLDAARFCQFPALPSSSSTFTAVIAPIDSRNYLINAVTT
nr:unnamed protein product [Digitaria exilis]